MNILFNTVMVRFDRENDELLLEGGHKLHLSTGWEPYKHAVTSGIVTALPNKLIFNRSDPNSLEYDTDMELQIGDRVIFDFKVESSVKKQAEPLDGSYPLRYDDIYVAIRNGEIVPVNGTVLVEACDTTVEEDVQQALRAGLNLPDTVLKEKSEIYGIVRHLGSPLRGYLRADPDLTEIHDEVNVGDKVVFHHVRAIELQYSLHQIIGRGNVIYRMRRKDILGIVQEA